MSLKNVNLFLNDNNLLNPMCAWFWSYKDENYIDLLLRVLSFIWSSADRYMNYSLSSVKETWPCYVRCAVGAESPGETFPVGLCKDFMILKDE
jgi:hypothetical protein